MGIRFAAIWLSLCALTACGDDVAPDSGSSDAGLDARSVDAPIDLFDAAIDAPALPDAGPLPPLEAAPPLVDISAAVIESITQDISPEFMGVAGASYTAVIAMGDTGQVLFELNPDAALIPASNTKLFTTASALEVLGADHQFPIQVYVSEMPSGGEVGQLVIIMEHDSTLSGTFYAAASDPLDRLARRLVSAGITRVRDRVVFSGGGVFNGQSLGGLNINTERAEIATTLGRAIASAGITAPPIEADVIGPPPAGYVLIAEAGSRALHVVASHINEVSHNELADELLRHFGYRVSGESGYVAGGRELVTWLGSTPVGSGSANIADGSGLSTGNRVSGRQVVDLLRFMRGEPVGALFQRGLAIGGVSGTIRGRLTGDDTRGRVFGKTGTLSAVIALSGTLINRHDGRPYDFSLIANGLQRSQRDGIKARFDRVVARLGQNHWNEGTQLNPPQLRSVVAQSDRLVVEFEPVSEAERIVLWRSADGFVFRRQDARLVPGGRRVEVSGDLPFIRLTAGNRSVESDPSDVYAAQSAGGDRVLLVDAFDRWHRQPAPENVLGANHDFMALYAEALAGRAFDTIANEALAEVDLSAYSAVIWVLGEESTDDETFDEQEQSLLRAYVEAGGDLMVTGAEVAWDLVEMGTPTDTDFASDVLRMGYAGDSAETFLVRGAPDSLFASIGTLGFLTPRGVLASFSDRLLPMDGSVAVLEYEGGLGGIAALASEQVIVFGFPLESLERQEDRRTILNAWLDR